MEDLPTIKKAFPLLLQQERQHGGPLDPKIIAAVTSTGNNQGFGWRGPSPNVNRGGYQGNRGRGRSSNNKICTFCGKERHTIETCYFKHGFPPNFGFRNKPAGPSSSPSFNNVSSTSNTGDQSHVLQEKAFTTAQYAEITEILKNINTQAPSSNSINHIMNSAQQETLQKSGSSCGANVWILDTGATDHVSNSL